MLRNTNKRKTNTLSEMIEELGEKKSWKDKKENTKFMKKAK